MHSHILWIKNIPTTCLFLYSGRKLVNLGETHTKTGRMYKTLELLVIKSTHSTTFSQYTANMENRNTNRKLFFN